MTTTQVLLLILVLLAVAVIGYRLGRQSSGQGTTNPNPHPAPSPSADTIRRTPIATSPARREAPPAPPRTTSRDMSRSSSTAPLAVTSWGYQLQKPKLQQLADSPFDLLVIDYTKDGDDQSAFTPTELARLKQKPDGSRRRVVAYLSIGEAESYRGYWQSAWKKQKPSWLLAENPEWEENYAVCFWDPGWQSIILGTPQSRLDRILSAGFDGVYLDKTDVFEDMRAKRMPEARSRRDLEADMAAFVTQISTYAKARKPDFLVIMQNTEVLLERADLRRVLDGVAKEELLYGVDSPERKNSRDDIHYSSERLDLMKADGKLVLVVEYLNNAAKIEDAVSTVSGLGYTLYISDKNRELDKLHTPPLIA